MQELEKEKKNTGVLKPGLDLAANRMGDVGQLGKKELQAWSLLTRMLLERATVLCSHGAESFEDSSP